jgi:undecaprenyl-phosphate 4-deoxy-4-formamido-L-arabinose transferase
MTVLLLVSGVQSMILGVLGEYVGRTFLSANGKPQGTIRLIRRNTGDQDSGDQDARDQDSGEQDRG